MIGIFELVAALLFLACVPLGWSSRYRTAFRKWLIGSRTTHYLDKDGAVRFSYRKFRTPADRVGTDADRNAGVIEINHGWFRRPSAIYGDYHISYWKVKCDRTDYTGVEVDLRNELSLPVEAALRLINTYPSLQAMLYRIAELEQELVREKRKRVESVAALQAITSKILDNKQRFRSPAAREIRDHITFVLREMAEVNIYHQPIDLWLEKFSKLDLKTGLLKPATK